MYLGYRSASRLTLFGALAAIVWRYIDSFLSIAQKWGDDTTFSHGYLILPIAGWLLWRKRQALAGIEWQASWFGAAATLVTAAVWVVARGTGVLVLEQAAAIAFVPALVITIIGPRAGRVVAFPLAFLFLAVPFGRALVPWLMQITADVATVALRASGIPIHRTQMYISIPSGDFVIAKACGGLNYFIAGLVLGSLYAYLTYATWRKRILCMLAFMTVPILANGLRVYVTIGVSHLTSMRFGPGYEHVTFGRIFFVVVMLAMFWVGRRWRDSHVTEPPASIGHEGRAGTAAKWLPICTTLFVAMTAPLYLSAFAVAADHELAGPGASVELPFPSAEWSRDYSATAWRPSFSGARTERMGVFRGGDGSRVDVYVGVYGFGSDSAGEMITSDNRFFPDEDVYLVDESIHGVSLGACGNLEVKQQVLGSAGTGRAVWHWFSVGPRRTVSPFRVKAYEALALVTRDPEQEMVVTLSTTLDDGSRTRLASFVEAHAACISSGFRPEQCR